MTEFTIVGNLREIDRVSGIFIVEEGKKEYTIQVSKRSTLIDDLVQIPPYSRIKVVGIIGKDNYGYDIFICNKATVMLGNMKDETN